MKNEVADIPVFDMFSLNITTTKWNVEAGLFQKGGVWNDTIAGHYNPCFTPWINSSTSDFAVLE